MKAKVFEVMLHKLPSGKSPVVWSGLQPHQGPVSGKPTHGAPGSNHDFWGVNKPIA
jgi:hypothetical protein